PDPAVLGTGEREVEARAVGRDELMAPGAVGQRGREVGGVGRHPDEPTGVPGPLSADDPAVPAPASSTPSAGRRSFGGSNRYPTLRTVPMSCSCSGPSLARRRRTWTSTVRVPP